jgi:transcriptional regulator with XRE-family HTH domain
MLNAKGVIMTVTSEQIRAARALLRWEQKDLAEASKVSLPSIKRLEIQPGALAAQDRTVAAIRAALESSGVIFVDDNGEGAGVRLRKAGSMAASILIEDLNAENDE